MTQTIQRKLNDSAFMRWTALILIALMMFFAYMFVDMMSPLQSMIEGQRGWSPDIFGAYGSSEYLLNVFGFLIVAGIILDKMGIRFTGTLSASLMVIGACIKFYGVSDWFVGSELDASLTSLNFMGLPGSALLACLGFMIFGCGCEMAGITVSRAIAKWFKGKEIAMAMGLEMAIARVGVFAIFTMSPAVANSAMFEFIPTQVVKPVFLCTVLLIIGLICFLVFSVMDKMFDKQLAAAGETSEETSEEEFKISDVKVILSSKIFWLVAMLCVLYYSAIFPFQRYATNMFENNLNLDPVAAASIFRWFPIGAALITPFLGGFLDKRGRGATMLILGALLMITCHLIFALVLPAFPNLVLAYVAIVVLGVSFSLVPAALWPSVPKLMPERYLGSAYSLIFWVQNVGLCLVPMLIGVVLDSSNPGVSEAFRYKSEIATLAEKVDYEQNIRDLEYEIAQYEQYAAVEGCVAMSACDKLEAKPLFADDKAVDAARKKVATLKAERYTVGINDQFNFAESKAEMERLIAERAEKKISENPKYNYTVPMLLFAGFGVLALFFGLWLKREDKVKGYGLELPNIKQD